ncbi:MAG: hypothetical protein M3Y74_20280, partial [Chloroflexota bacterium]|nr:hypothetical protein [Chloroflexota bacterium]
MNSKRGLARTLDPRRSGMVTRPETATGWGGAAACLRAMGYVARRRWARRLRGVAGKPWELLALLLAVALIAVGEVAALRQSAAGAAYLTRIDLALRLAPLVLTLVIGRATSRSPLRLAVADVSWLLTAPGGARAVFIWKLLARPVQFAVAGYLGTVAARWWLGLPLGQAWTAVLAGAIIALAARLASFGSYIIAIRARAGAALRALAVLWALALIVAALVDVPGREWIALRPVTDRLAIAVLEPAAASTVWLLILLAALLATAALLTAAARGFEERAETAARQGARVHEEMRRTRSGQEMMAAQFRTGLRSLPAWPPFAGERALCYRVLAQGRRIIRASLGTLAVLLAIALVLRVFAPGYAWAPAALALLSAPTAAGAADGLAAELDHYHLRLAPLRPLPALLWVSVIPVVRLSVITEVLWLAALAAPGLTTATWVAGAVLIPCAVVLAAAAGSLGIASAEGALSRV